MRAPVDTDGGVRIDLGRQDDASRHVLSAFDPESISRLGEVLTTRGTDTSFAPRAPGVGGAYRSAVRDRTSAFLYWHLGWDPIGEGAGAVRER